MIDDRYELYRVVTDFDALQEAFRDRVEDLDVTRESLDEAGGFTVRHSAKLLAANPARSFGNVSLPKMLKATGMVLVLVIDDERFAEVKEKLVKRRRPPVERAIAGSKPPAWLFAKEKAREMGKRRFALMTEAQRKRHQRKAGKASGAARRRRSRERQQEQMVSA